MATYYSGWSNGYRLIVDATNVEVSEANVTSKVQWVIKLEFSNKTFNGLVDHGYININGVRQWTAPGSYNFTGVYYTVYTLGSGTTGAIAHNSDGTKTVNITASFSATSGGWGPSTMTINVNFTLANITVWTAATAPTSTSVTSTKVVYDRIVPGSNVTISWSGAKSGTRNSITSYSIDYWKVGSSAWVTNWKTGITGGSWTGALPSSTRGDGFLFAVRAVAEKNTTGRGPNSAYIYNNTLPAAPTVSWPTSGTVVSTTTSISYGGRPPVNADGQIHHIRYNTSNTSSTSSTLSPGTPYTRAVSASGTYNFYFWTWDGLEFSSVVSRSVVKNAKPSISGFTSSETSYTDPSSSGIASGAIITRASTMTATTSKNQGTVYFYGRTSTSSTVPTSEPLQNLGNTAVSSSKAALSVDYLNTFSASLNRYAKVYARFHDGLEWSDYVTLSKLFYLGSHIKKSGPGLINRPTTNASASVQTDLPNTQNNYFHNLLTFTHTAQPFVQRPSIVWSTNPSAALADRKTLAYTTGGSGNLPTTGTTDKYYRFEQITGPQTRNTVYHFWARTTYPKGEYTDSYLGSKTKVPAPNLGTLTGSTYYPQVVENPASILRASYPFSESYINTYNLVDDTVRIVRGSAYRTLSPTKGMEGDTRTLDMRYDHFYPLLLTSSTQGSSNDPFNLGFNTSGTNNKVTMEVTRANIFGENFTITKDFYPNLTFVPQLPSGILPKVSLKRATSFDDVTVANTLVFEKEQYSFSIPTVKTRIGVPVTYKIHRSLNSGAWAELANTTINGTGNEGVLRSEVWSLTAPARSTASATARYKMSYYDGLHEGELEITPSSPLKFAQFTPVSLTLHTADKNTTENWEIQYTLNHFGGDVDGATLKGFQFRLEISTEPNFTNPIQIDSPLITTDLSTYLGSDKIYTYDDTRTLPNRLHYVRLLLITYPKTGDPEGQLAPASKTSLSNSFYSYPMVPSYRWRSGFFGLNTMDGWPSDLIMDISATATQKKIRIFSGSNIITIDAESGEVDGTVIDGGSW